MVMHQHATLSACSLGNDSSEPPPKFEVAPAHRHGLHGRYRYADSWRSITPVSGFLRRPAYHTFWRLGNVTPAIRPFLSAPVTSSAEPLKAMCSCSLAAVSEILLNFIIQSRLFFRHVLVVAITAFLTIVWKHRSDFVLLEAGDRRTRDRVAGLSSAFAAAWFLSYAIFLLFWLPRNTFYKLLAWPALIFLLGWLLHVFRQRGGALRYRTALFASIMLLWNFVFFVYPNSKPESNPLLVFTTACSPTGPPGRRFISKRSIPMTG